MFKSRFSKKHLEIPTKKRIFAATNPTTPLNDAYHGGTSLFIWVRLPLNWITPSQKPIKLYHQLCTLLYLEQTIKPSMDLKSSLLKLFAKYSNVDLHAMGFPQGWENEPLWR